MTKPKMIVLMGGQGVGKGTQARRLIKDFGYKYIEAGAILRDLPPESPVAQIMARGELVPDKELFKIIGNAIQNTGNTDIIVDGFPRTIGQAEWLVEQFANKCDIHILYLNVPEKIMLERIENRIREGGGRADDADANIVRRRLDNFWKTTMPAIEWLRTVSNIVFSDIDVSEFEFESNYAKVCQALKLNPKKTNK